MGFGVVLATIGALFVFGYVYDQVIGWLERWGYDEGYRALLVVFGVLVTVGGGALIGWVLLAWLRELLVPWAMAVVMFAGNLAAFGASGVWMVVGSSVRYARRRRAGQERYLSSGGVCND